MKHSLPLVAYICLCLVLTSSVEAQQDKKHASVASEIEKADGTVISGVVHRMVCVGGVVREKVEGPRTLYEVTYTIADGDVIRKISRDGMWVKDGEAVIVIVARREGMPPDERQTLTSGIGALMAEGSPKAVDVTRHLKGGGMIIVRYSPITSPLRAPLLGLVDMQVRIHMDDIKKPRAEVENVRIVPWLLLQAGKDTLKILVEEIAGRDVRPAP